MTQCPTPTALGDPCKGRVPPGRVFCMSHDPERRQMIKDAARKGGHAKGNAKRAAKAWAAIGEQVTAGDLPAMLRACMIAVRDGEMTPGEAQAIASLAKTSVQVAQEMELTERVRALEEAAGVDVPANVRRFG